MICCDITNELLKNLQVQELEKLTGLAIPSYMKSPVKAALDAILSHCPVCGKNRKSGKVIASSDVTAPLRQTSRPKCLGEGGCNGTGLVSGVAHARCLGTGEIQDRISPPLTPEQQQRHDEQLRKAEKAPPPKPETDDNVQSK